MYARQFPGLEGRLHGHAELQSSNVLQKSVNLLTSINQILSFFPKIADFPQARPFQISCQDQRVLYERVEVLFLIRLVLFLTSINQIFIFSKHC